MVELEPVSSNVEMVCVDPRTEEEKEKLDVTEDGFCNVLCDALLPSLPSPSFPPAFPSHPFPSPSPFLHPFVPA